MLGLLALFAWVVVGLLFVRAVASPTEDLETPASGGWSSGGEFVVAAMDQIRSDRDAIRARSKHAVWATLAAVLVTALALVVGVFDQPEKAGATPAAFVWYGRSWSKADRAAFERVVRSRGGDLTVIYRTHPTVRHVLGVAD